MVLNNKIQKHSRLLLNRRIQLHAVKRLIYLSDGTSERIVLLIAEKSRPSELLTKLSYLLHGTLVSGAKSPVGGSVPNAQPLIVVIV